MIASPPRALAALLLLLHAAAAYEGLRVRWFNTTSFVRGDLTYELITLSPSLQLSAFAGPFTSLRFEGTVSAPTSGAVNFSLVTDGNVRLWVDDHLVLDDALGTGAPRTVTGPAPAIMSVGVPTPLRIEYQRGGGTLASSLLNALWAVGGSAAEPVPSAALAPDVRHAGVCVCVCGVCGGGRGSGL